MKVAIIVEAIPPFCGGAEQVAWVHAVEMAKRIEVAVVTYGRSYEVTSQEGVTVCYLPFKKRNLLAYSTIYRSMFRDCIDRIRPSVLHCHMPRVLAACAPKDDRLIVSTIHDGVPENELLALGMHSRLSWLRFKFMRRFNISKADAVTCVSRHNLDVMRSIYPTYAGKFSFIPNPIADKYFTPVVGQDGRYVLNFGRQIPLKVAALLDAARIMPETRFVFVGTGEMVRDHGLPNVEFVGFSDAVEKYIDAATVCVFPSLSENFPLVGLEAMARGKPVIATKRGFSEYVQHLENGFLLDSTEPAALKAAIDRFMGDAELCRRIGQEGRLTAEAYRPAHIVEQYLQLYERAGKESMHHHRSKSV